MASKCISKPKPTPPGKRKRNILSLKTKMEIIEEYEHGKSRVELMNKYGLKKSTIHDILKSKDKIRESVKKLGSGPKGVELFRARKLPFEGLDEVVFQWYKQQRAEGVPTRGLDIQLAAVRLAARLGHENFKCSDGWLWRFRRRHGIVSRAINREMLNAGTEAVNRFKDELKQLVEDEGLQHFQIYSADETGLLWRSLPRNMQASQEISQTLGHEILEDRVSVLACSNVDGSHRLWPVIVGKSESPKILKEIMTQLPVEYHGNKSASFTQELFTDWFHHVFDPEVRCQQTQLGIKSDDMKALLLLNDTLAHPSSPKLTSKDGCIKALFLPPHTSTLIQPMNQGVIESCKRHYRNLYMQQCLVVIEDDMDKPDYVDTRAKETLENFKKYSLKDAVYNWAEAWKKVPLNILQNAWTKLLPIAKVTSSNSVGFDTSKMVNMLGAAGQGELREDELEYWLNEDAEVTGHHRLTEEEIAEEFLASKKPEGETEEAPGPSLAEDSIEEIVDKSMISKKPREENKNKEEEPSHFLTEGSKDIVGKSLVSKRPNEKNKKEKATPGPSLAAGIEAADTILSIIDKRGGSLMKHYEMMQVLRLELLQQQE